MAIIRQRKKNIIIAAAAGLMAGLLPAGLVAAIMSAKYISLDKEYSQAKEAYKEYKGLVLAGEMEKGDVIGSDDLKEAAFYSNLELTDTDKEDFVGKTLRQEAKEGIIITESMVYDDTGVSDDLRMYMFDYIAVPEGIEKGDVFDIRISFPNGEDYIVARAKTIESRSETGIFVNATEKELLMISSAYVDTTIYDGAKIYASMYVTDYQELPVVNYPVNMYVTKLAEWNPNLLQEVEEALDLEKRKILEENLYEFMGVTMEACN